MTMGSSDFRFFLGRCSSALSERFPAERFGSLLISRWLPFPRTLFLSPCFGSSLMRKITSTLLADRTAFAFPGWGSDPILKRLAQHSDRAMVPHRKEINMATNKRNRSSNRMRGTNQGGQGGGGQQSGGSRRRGESGRASGGNQGLMQRRKIGGQGGASGHL